MTKPRGGTRSRSRHLGRAWLSVLLGVVMLAASLVTPDGLGAAPVTPAPAPGGADSWTPPEGQSSVEPLGERPILVDPGKPVPSDYSDAGAVAIPDGVEVDEPRLAPWRAQGQILPRGRREALLAGSGKETAVAGLPVSLVSPAGTSRVAGSVVVEPVDDTAAVAMSTIGLAFRMDLPSGVLPSIDPSQRPTIPGLETFQRRSTAPVPGTAARGIPSGNAETFEVPLPDGGVLIGSRNGSGLRPPTREPVPAAEPSAAEVAKARADSGWRLRIDISNLDIPDVGGLAGRLRPVYWSGCRPGAGCQEMLPLDYGIEPATGVMVVSLPVGVVMDLAGAFAAAPRTEGAAFAGAGGSGGFGLVGSTGGSDLGDYAASPVESLASYQVGIQTGSAEISYPFSLPPSQGPVPSLGLYYSSGAVDGRNASTQAQSGLVGVGWSTPEWGITRAFKSCSSQGTDNRCYAAGRDDGFTLNMDGLSSRLVKLDPPPPGSNTVTVDGTAYFFQDYATEIDTGFRVRRLTPVQGPDLDAVAVAAPPGGGGLWTVDAAGRVQAEGTAVDHGGLTSAPSQPIVGIVSSATGDGYLLIGADGGVFTFGDAVFHGSLPGLGISVTNIVGGALTPTGYVLAGADGGVFAFNTTFHGSLSGTTLPAGVTVVDIAVNTGGDEYWLARSDGLVQGFGPGTASGEFTSVGNDLVALEAGPSGGYWGVTETGDVYAGGAAGTPASARWRAHQRVKGLAWAGSGSQMWALEGQGRVIPLAGANWVPAAHRDRYRQMWQVTGPDGTISTFGLSHEPTSMDETHSVRTIPVQDTGEGCDHDLCDVAWFWGLDRIEDTSANVVTFTWANQDNFMSAQIPNTSQRFSRGYTRGGVLLDMLYGVRSGEENTWAPHRVLFGYSQRCANPNPDGTCSQVLETPTDQVCQPFDETCMTLNAAFFTDVRLVSVTTQRRPEANEGSDWVGIEAWSFDVSWPDPGTGPNGVATPAKMVLDRINHQSADGTATVPPVVFTHAFLANRAENPLAAGVSPMRMARIASMTTELSGKVSFTYGQTHPFTTSPGQCQVAEGQTLPTRCDMYPGWDPYPVDQYGNSLAGWVMWNKWKVMTETRDPRFAGSPPEVLTYTYDPAGPWWHYAETWGHTVTAANNCDEYGCFLWSDYRGHQMVTVSDSAGSSTVYRFFTGMDGDRTPGNTDGTSFDSHSVNSYDSGPYTDAPWLAGRTVDVVTQGTTGGGSTVTLARSLSMYGTSAPRGAWPQSRRVYLEQSYQKTWDHNGANPTQRRMTYAYDSYGNPTFTHDWGSFSVIETDPNAGTPGPTATSTRWDYKYNTTDWLVGFPTYMRRYPGVGTSAANPFYTEAYYYDGNGWNVVPTAGLRTRHSTHIRNNSSGNPIFADTYTTYEPTGQPATVTDPTGTITTTTYDDRHRPKSVTVTVPRPGQSDLVMTTGYADFDSFSHPTTITDANGRVTTLAYDALGRLTNVRRPGTDPNKWSVIYSYFLDDHTVGSLNPTIVHTQTLRDPGAATFEYHKSWQFLDGFGRPIQTQTVDPNTPNTRVLVSTTYNDTGRVAYRSAPTHDPGSAAGNGYSLPTWGSVASYQRFSYNSTGLTITEQMAAGTPLWSSSVQVSGHTTTSIDPDGRSTTSTTDIYGRTVDITDAAGAHTTYTYDLRGDVVGVNDPSGHVTTYTYADDSLWATTVNDPDMGTSTFTYDSAGRVVTRTAADGQVLYVEWDGLGRRHRIREDNSTGPLLAAWSWDPSGNLGALASSASYTATGAPDITVANTYDSRGRVSQRTWTIPGAPQPTYTIGYTWREAGGTATVTLPDGEVVTTGYDALEEPLDLTSSTQGTIVDQVTYTPAGQVSHIDRGPNGSGAATQYTYDSSTLRLSSLITTANSGADDVQDLRYTYTPAGDITQVWEKPQGVSQYRCYGYDSLHRLTTAYTNGSGCGQGPDSTGPDPFNRTYTYAPDGNLTQAVHEGTTLNYGYGAGAHGATAVGSDTLTYNADGTTATWTTGGSTSYNSWDPRNQLSAIGTTPGGTDTAQFRYDADTNRVVRDIGGTITYSLDGMYEITVTPSGSNGSNPGTTPATVTSAIGPILAAYTPVTGPLDILYVAGSTAPPGADVTVRNHLQAAGHTVTIVDDDTATAADATGKDLVIISSSVSPSTVGATFKTVTVPVITWEGWIFKDMGFAATEGETSANLTQLTITDPTHPIAAGYSGTQTVSSGGNKFSHAYTLGSGAEPVATTTSATEYVIFAYDTSAQMNSGVAAARRVGFNWTYGTPDTANAVGWDLFDAAIDWAVGATGNGGGGGSNQPPVISQITATPGTTITLPTDTVTLDATTSDPDSGPAALTYAWSTISAPTGGTVTFGTPTAEDTTATFNIAGSYTLRLTADDSADVTTSDIAITVNPDPGGGGGGSGPLDILYVASSTSPPGADVTVRNHLQAAGHTVTIVDDNTATAADATGKDLVIISSSVSPSTVGATFKTVTVPVLTWEGWIFKDMGFAATEGETSANLTQLTIVNPTHPIAAGYSGTQTVSTGGNKFSHAYTLGSGAEPVATTTSSSTEYVIFAYDTAAQMNSGTAAARRVGFNWTYGTPDTANTVGWDLFDAAVDWAAGTTSGGGGGSNQPPVISQITATPGTTITLPTDTVTLDATTSDPDSGPAALTYTWSTVSAPTGGTATFGTPTAEDTTATFNIAGSYTLRLTADDTADTTTADITITVDPDPGSGGGGPLDILYVAGSTAPPGADVTVRNHLQTAGHTVTVVDDDTVTAGDATGRDLVIISSSVVPSKVGATFKTVTVPVLTWEGWLFADMGFAATEGETSANLTQLTIVDPTHPIAAGYQGTQTVSSGGNKFSHAYTLGSGAEPVATTTGSSTEYVIFAYDTAAQMNSGTAAARRVGFNWSYGTPDTANTVGWDLFDAAVDWAAGTQGGQSGNQPPVVSQITATPATTITLPTDTVTLDAVTSDPDSGPAALTYAWSTVSAPTGGTVTFGTPTAEDTSATFNIAGSYTLRLTADDSTDTAVGDITITVNPQPPAVSTRVTYSIAGQTVAVANSTLTWILGDHQGSTSTAITAGQATTIRYNPYGTQRGNASIPTDRTYTGQTADPTTGLMYYRSRYYNPATGQFTQPDTATPPGPPGLNRHAYTNGNPIGFTDPTGHFPCPGCGIVKDKISDAAHKIGDFGKGVGQGVVDSIKNTADSIRHPSHVYRPIINDPIAALKAAVIQGAKLATLVSPLGPFYAVYRLATDPNGFGHEIGELIPLAATIALTEGVGALADGAETLETTTALDEIATSGAPGARFITNGAGDLLDTTRVTIPEGKFGYLLGDPSKSGVFTDSMGFSQQTLDPALRSHLVDNFATATDSVSIPGGGTKFSVTGPMTGPSGEKWTITTAWAVDPDGTVRLITATP